MRVPAINSSPRSGGHSKTGLMLRHLVDGNLLEYDGEDRTAHLGLNPISCSYRQLRI